MTGQVMEVVSSLFLLSSPRFLTNKSATCGIAQEATALLFSISFPLSNRLRIPGGLTARVVRITSGGFVNWDLALGWVGWDGWDGCGQARLVGTYKNRW